MQEMLKMNQAYRGNNPDGSADVPVKRKRGRPRKYPRLDLEERAHVPKNQSVNRGENGRDPPVFDGGNGNQPRQVDSINDANDVMVGQVVSGVIEAGFDAGYLLSVRVANSDATLRGVVFKPGHYSPVSAENDVAPGIRMIRRNEIHFPAETYTQVHGYNPRSREREQNYSNRNVTHPVNEIPVVNQVPGVVTHSSKLVTSKGKRMPSVAAQTTRPVIPRGNVVPVVLQPANGVALANEPSAVAIQATHLASSTSKQVIGGTQSSDGSMLNNQVSTIGDQVPASQPQAINQVTPIDLQSEHVHSSQPPAERLPDMEGKPVRFPGMPSGNSSPEVSKRSQTPSESVKTEITSSRSAGKMSVKVSGHVQKDEVNDVDQPLLIEPLQAVQPDLHDHPNPALKPFENHITSKMTELLQVLQENATENQVPQGDKLATVSVLKIAEQRNPETDARDGEIGSPNKQSRASSV